MTGEIQSTGPADPSAKPVGSLRPGKAPTYAWSCLQCPAHGTGPKVDLDARKHEAETKHSTSTHIAGGPFDRGRTA